MTTHESAMLRGRHYAEAMRDRRAIAGLRAQVAAKDARIRQLQAQVAQAQAELSWRDARIARLEATLDMHIVRTRHRDD